MTMGLCCSLFPTAQVFPYSIQCAQHLYSFRLHPSSLSLSLSYSYVQHSTVPLTLSTLLLLLLLLLLPSALTSSLQPWQQQPAASSGLGEPAELLPS
jgi:hypothetical protein